MNANTQQLYQSPGLIWPEDIPSYILIQWETFDFVTEYSFDLI